MRYVFMILLFVLLPSVGISQQTVYVPDDFATIQGALSDISVVDGDIIVVRPGTYVENIDFLGKNVHLKSSEGYSVTFIDGNQAGTVVTFANGENAGAILNGFTIMNGSGALAGGILCSDTSPTIANNEVNGNDSMGTGGGIRIESGTPMITGNIITGNSTDNNGGG
ncbi:MAG: hypothetical protein KJ645_01145, partial [Planctomycetes bacterium]|nr:hypothetical protein [Planctomycetota bacterium]